MDTRFWGKSGWQLSHSIVARYPINPTDEDKFKYYLIFYCYQYILPCIFCRMSFTEYFATVPIYEYLDSREHLCEWLYKIHNLVNDKLRKQGYNHNEDPSFDEVYDLYDKYVDEINNVNCIEMPGWNFIYSIYFNYGWAGSPHPQFPNAPTIEERRPYYLLFLETLEYVIPFNVARTIITNYDIPKRLEEILQTPTLDPNGGNEFARLIYCLEKQVKDYVNCKCLNYDDRCKYIEQYRAGCKGTKTMGTCHL